MKSDQKRQNWISHFKAAIDLQQPEDGAKRNRGGQLLICLPPALMGDLFRDSKMPLFNNLLGPNANFLKLKPTHVVGAINAHEIVTGNDKIFYVIENQPLVWLDLRSNELVL